MTVTASFDPAFALRASGLLATFNVAGILTSADVHVASRVGRLAREDDDRVLLAAALAVRAARSGSVCVDLGRARDTTPREDAGSEETARAADTTRPPGPTMSADPVRFASTARSPDTIRSAGTAPAPDALPWPAVTDWIHAVEASPMVAVGRDGPSDRPLRWVNGLLYLDRYWRDEERIRADVDERLATPLPVDLAALGRAVARAFPDPADTRQRAAAAACVLSRLTVLTGGPGTGKTTTIAGILDVLHEVAGPRLSIALAAPTGKAAARLSEAVREARARQDGRPSALPEPTRATGRTALTQGAEPTGRAEPTQPTEPNQPTQPTEPTEPTGQVEPSGRIERAEPTQPTEPTESTELAATTVHRLLGWRRGSTTRFRHDRSRRLPHDLVVVDETSMMSLPLIARLLEALRPDARLLLVGDPDQLASVEAGAVLGDLVERPAQPNSLPDLLAAVARNAPDLGNAQAQAPPHVPRAAPARRTPHLPSAEPAPSTRDLPSAEPTPSTRDLPNAPTAGGSPQPSRQPGPPDPAQLHRGVVRLVTVHRHGGQIGRLADAVRDGDAEAAVAALVAQGNAVLVDPGGPEDRPAEGNTPRVGPSGGPDAQGFDPRGRAQAGYPHDTALDQVRQESLQAGLALRSAARAGDVSAALAALASHRLLLAHRTGRFGASHWARRVEAWIDDADATPGRPGTLTPHRAGRTFSQPPWYVGQPLLVTANDRTAGLYNGDTGVIVDDGEGGLIAVFGDAERPITLRPHRLPEVETLYAMTVHKAQGSQFAAVSLILPPTTSPLLTRELFYTGLTRARDRLVVIGSREAVAAAVTTRVQRASGLRLG